MMKSDGQHSEDIRSLLSPPELALLGSLAEDLGEKHKNIRAGSEIITRIHPSSVCRAVASAILSIHIAAFQRCILEVEKDILAGNAKLTGAYNIVPLSALVGSFDGWGRRLEWLWNLVQFMQAPSTSVTMTRLDSRKGCSAAQLIEKLRNSVQTGYPDLEEMSLSLLKVAETAWLKQVSAWVLYGRHPGAPDFFVAELEKRNAISSPLEAYTVAEDLLPLFVTPYTATSVLFIGRALNHIRERRSSSTEVDSQTVALDVNLLPAHLAQISAIRSPINSPNFTAAISAIRTSLSRNALQKLLPMSKVLNILYVFRDFFLLERGEFAVALIAAADERVSPSFRRGAKSRRAVATLDDDLASMTIKEGEVHSVLTRTWTTLASLQGRQDEEDIDEELDAARELLRLSIKSIENNGPHEKHSKYVQTPAFDDLLLPSATALSLKVPPPLDLFLSAEDTDAYARIHAYLLAIRRAHSRLSKLFQLSKLRRDFPTPRAPGHLPPQARSEILKNKRLLSNERTKTMRPIWATIRSATFFMAELGEYFQGEVVQRAWTSFHSWLIPPAMDYSGTSAGDLTPNFEPSSVGLESDHQESRPRSSHANDISDLQSVHDPESLTHAHRCYLDALAQSLLLHEVTFTAPLRRLMTSIDHTIALMQRLDTLQTSLDNETDARSDHSTSHYSVDEQNVLTDLRLSLPKVDNGIKELVQMLRNIDNAKTSGKAAGPVNQGTRKETDRTVFEPWSTRGLDRLLLKFDYQNAGRLSLQQVDMG